MKLQVCYCVFEINKTTGMLLCVSIITGLLFVHLVFAWCVNTINLLLKLK